MFSAIKSAVVLGVCLFLQGCFYQAVNSFDIYKAIRICGSLEDIVEIASHFTGMEKVLCKNNKIYHL